MDKKMNTIDFIGENLVKKNRMPQPSFICPLRKGAGADIMFGMNKMVLASLLFLARQAAQ
jgi:hypothetical protein